MKASLVATVVAAAFAATEAYPAISVKSCSSAGCTTEAATIIWDKLGGFEPTAEVYAKNGAVVSGDSIKLVMTNGNGPRVYLGAGDGKTYKNIKIVGREIAYDIDTSTANCNMNGALYFVQMPFSGGADGSGYCDANGGGGGHNCPEMDIWEGNQYANVFTAHADPYDGGGCGYNPYARGQKTFFGSGSSFTVDSSKPFTVITQFLTNSSGVTTEIRRLYQQNGKTIEGGVISTACNANTIAGMGKAMQDGTVMAFSFWSSDSLEWLDGGGWAGPCPIGSTSKNATLTFSNIRVGDLDTTYSGKVTPTPTTTSTKTPTPAPTPTPTPTPTTTSTSSPTPTTTSTTTPAPTPAPGGAKLWGQCGGNGWTGPTTCAEGKCTKYNDWYSQCV